MNGLKDYYGLTHPFGSSKPVLWFWKRAFCKRQMHLFDEVGCSAESSVHQSGNYLICDACQLVVGIDYIEEYEPDSPNGSEEGTGDDDVEGAAQGKRATLGWVVEEVAKSA